MTERLWRGCGWLGIVLTLLVSLLPPALEGGESHIDKFAHLAGYTLLMFWWAQLIVQKRWKLAVAVVLFGIAIELLQGLTPDRQPDPLDALANTAGALLGWLIARLAPNLPERIAVRRATLPALRR